MTERVPFVDLQSAYRELEDELTAAVARVATSGYYLMGPELRGFEESFARYVGARHCIGVANGLDALHLSLRAMGIGSGDEVIVPSNTYVATWLAVTHCGAVPVPVEPDPATCNIDPERIAAALTPRTKAILPVHLYGQPADLSAIMALAEQHGLKVLDDAAQAHGARIRDTRVGASTDVTAWSFYPTKNLGAWGDAGAITTNDDRLADTLRVMRNYGSRVRYVNEVVGFNSRLDEVQAAVLSVKLGHLDDWNARRERLATNYLEQLCDLPFVLPVTREWAKSVWHLFVIHSPHRDALQRRLADAGIDTIVHYPVAPHMQAAYASLEYAPEAFPIARRLHDEALSLPLGPHLTTEQQGRVITTLRDAVLQGGLA